MRAKIKRWVAGAVLGLVGVLFATVQYFRGVARDQKRKREAAEERAQVSEALRQQERDIQAARGVVQESARDAEKSLEAARAEDRRPAVFGDPRLHARNKDRL